MFKPIRRRDSVKWLECTVLNWRRIPSGRDEGSCKWGPNGVNASLENLGVNSEHPPTEVSSGATLHADNHCTQ